MRCAYRSIYRRSKYGFGVTTTSILYYISFRKYGWLAGANLGFVYIHFCHFRLSEASGAYRCRFAYVWYCMHNLILNPLYGKIYTTRDEHMGILLNDQCWLVNWFQNDICCAMLQYCVCLDETSRATENQPNCV